MERNVKSGPNTMSIKSSQVIYMGRQLQSLCNKMFCTETVLNVTHVDRNCRPETDQFIWNVQYNSEGAKENKLSYADQISLLRKIETYIYI